MKSVARCALRRAQRRCLLTVLPAAGYRNCNGDVNNVGSNGNYWSSTPNQLRFEMDLETNLIHLYYELRDRRGASAGRT